MTRYKIPADLIAEFDGDQDATEKFCRDLAHSVDQTARERLIAMADADPNLTPNALCARFYFTYERQIDPSAIAILLQDAGR